MATKIRLAPVPVPALMYLRAQYPPLMTQEPIINQVLRQRGIGDGLIRDIALKQGITLSEVVRRETVKAHPRIELLWPPARCTARQLESAQKKTKAAPVSGMPEHPYRAEIRRAASIMGKLLSNVDSLRFRNQARAFIEEWGP